MNLLTALFNILLVPLFSVIFVLIFIFIIVSFIFPFFATVNVIPNYALNLYNHIVEYFAKVNSLVKINNLGSVCLILFIIFILIVGNYCILKFKPKIILSAMIFVSCIVFGIFNLIPKQYNTNSIVVLRTRFDNCYMLTTQYNNRVIVANSFDNYSVNTLSSYFSRHNITNINAILTLNNQLTTNETKSLCNQLKCEIVEINENNFYEYQTKDIYNLNVSVTNSVALKKCFVVSLNNKNILFSFKKLNMGEQEDLLLNYAMFDVVICKDKNYVNLDGLKIVYNNESADNIISSKQQNFFTLKI